MSEWCKYDSRAQCSLVARVLPWGVQGSYAAGKDSEPSATEPTWDLSVAELEWLLELAKEAPNAG